MKSSLKRIPISLFNKLLPASKLESFAVKYKIDRANSVKLSGDVVFCTLLRGLLYDTNVSLRAMADKFHDFTNVELHYSSLSKCLRSINVGYFEDIYGHVSGLVKEQVNPRSPGPLSIIKVDATIVSITAKLQSFGLEHKSSTPGKDRPLVKSVFALHDQMPEFLRLCSEVEEHSDNKAIGDAIKARSKAGEVYVFDKGCSAREVLKAIHNSGAYFVTRLGTHGLSVPRRVFTADSEAAPVTAPGKDDPKFVVASVEECVFANSSPAETKRYAHMRLAIIRGYRYDSRGTEPGWKPLVIMTNMPISEDGKSIGPYSYVEVAQLYCDRWEIETFFKKIKGHLCFDHLLSRSENGIKIMIYMTLIAAMLMIWAKAVTKIQDGWNSVKFWLEVSCREWIDEIIETQYHLDRFRFQTG